MTPGGGLTEPAHEVVDEARREQRRERQGEESGQYHRPFQDRIPRQSPRPSGRACRPVESQNVRRNDKNDVGPERERRGQCHRGDQPPDAAGDCLKGEEAQDGEKRRVPVPLYDQVEPEAQVITQEHPVPHDPARLRPNRARLQTAMATPSEIRSDASTA